MAVSQQQELTIVGCGPGSPEYLTEAGRLAIGRASALAGAAHLLEQYAAPSQERIVIGADIEAGLDAVAARRAAGKAVAVLVSGDPGVCSLARPVIRRFGQEACRVIPGVSSVQLAFARLGLEWTEARILSAHKSLPAVTADALRGFKAVAVLCGHRLSREWVADLALAFGPGCELVVCEDLSLDKEKIRRVSREAFQQLELSSRTIVILLKEGES